MFWMKRVLLHIFHPLKFDGKSSGVSCTSPDILRFKPLPERRLNRLKPSKKLKMMTMTCVMMKMMIVYDENGDNDGKKGLTN